MDSPPINNLFAGIDIGSHTTRMLIARLDGNEIVPLRSERRVTRLARGFQASGAIVQEAEAENLSALKEYVSILNDFGVEHIACGATGVVRRADNSASVLDRISVETGLKADVLSEETEAFLSARGALSVLPETQKDLLAFDIGGGSTEFVLVLSGGNTPAWSASRPIGASTITEAFLSGDPPGPQSVQCAEIEARKQILSAREQMRETLAKAGIISFSGQYQLAGTAGTVTTLAAMRLGMDKYIPYRVNGLSISQQWLSAITNSLAVMSLAVRRSIAGLEQGREDIILGGALIALEILACFNQDNFMVTDAGLLEGLLLDLVEKQRAACSSPAGLRTDLTWRLEKR